MKNVLVAVALLLTAVTLTAESRTLRPEDFAKFREVGAPRISPDGRWVAYTVRQPDLEADKNRTHIWLASWDGAEQFQATFSKSSESSPEWSPDGKRLAFLSGRDAEDDNDGDQLWIMNRSGGEAEKVTDFKGNVADYAWGPDGTKLALIVEDADPQQPADAKTKTRPPVVIDRFYFKEDGSGYLTTRRQHLYLFDLATRKAENLTPGAFNEHLPSWSPDGKQLAFVSNRADDNDRGENYDIYVIDAIAGATARRLTTYAGGDSDPSWGSRPEWSPDGKSIAYVQGGPREVIYYGSRDVAVIPAAGGTPKIVTASLDRKLSRPQWSRDGKSIYFNVDDDRTEPLARVPAGGGAVEMIVSGRRVVGGFDVGPNDAIAMQLGDDLHPAEVFVRDAKGERQLSRQNADLLAQLALGKVEDLDVTSKDGTSIHGFVVTPPNFDATKKYPAILRIHGGPALQFAHRFSFEWQLLAANGYVVVAANPRGSSGRGVNFSKAIWADWGHLDAQDVLAAVDAVVARGIADPNRLGVGGWSYGGILTNYVIAQDKRFKAATSGASMSNVLAGYGTDMYVREYELELGRPWEHPDIYQRLSFPFLHADRIVTPTLFLGGDKDFNVPLLNSEQMYQALRSLNVPTQLVIYPGQYHGISKPSYVRDRYQRYLDWYAKYLK